jgi:copper chaperone CopZ
MSATTEHVELPITGMTCASCANRIERNLNRLDGVTATVNYATEKARVRFDPGAVDAEQLLGAVADAGYAATLPASESAAADERAGSRRTRSPRCADASCWPRCCRCRCWCCRWCRPCSSTTSSGCR